VAVSNPGFPSRFAAWRERRRTIAMQKWGQAYILVAPAIVLIALMMFYPVVQTLWFSVNKVQLPAFRTTWVGLDNFIRVLEDADTWPLFLRTVTWILGTVVLRMALGLGAALVFNAKVRGTIWMRVLAVLPWTIPSVVSSNLWRWIVQTDVGVLNLELKQWGLGAWAVSWLSNPDSALWTVIVAYSWSGYPFVMLLILARMQGIPEELYEAAKVDGANWWQQFRFITVPSLKGVLGVALILEVVSAVNSFDTIMIMTGGGPANATRIWGIEIYKRGFTNFDLGGASAMSVLMFVGALVFFVIYGIANKVAQKREVAT
jgi:multiple sugar transport system permease protein